MTNLRTNYSGELSAARKLTRSTPREPAPPAPTARAARIGGALSTVESGDVGAGRSGSSNIASPQRRGREVLHAEQERRLRKESELGRGPGWRGDDVSDIAGPELTGDAGRGTAAALGQRGRHLADRVRLTGGDVVCPQSWLQCGDRLDRGHVGPGHVGDVDEVAPLPAVLKDPCRLSGFEAGPEDGG